MTSEEELINRSFYIKQCGGYCYGGCEANGF